MSGRLEGKVAVITGGGSGIGRAYALAFAREGATALVCDVAPDAAAEHRGSIEPVITPSDVSGRVAHAR
jgi:NAD(P)-dependent dehydrogenase (short-subunit alcohol dehydrogenase family)